MMIAETAAGESGGDKAAWITSALEREAPRFSHVRALVWFNVDDPRGDFRANSSNASLRAFRNAVNSPSYSATRRTLLKTPALLPAGAPAPLPPDGGYGAPSFLEKLWLKVHGKYVWLVCAVVLSVLALTAAVLAMRRRSRRRGAPV